MLIGPGLIPVALALSALGWIGAWGRFTSTYAYAWLVFSMTATMAILAALTDPATLAPSCSTAGLRSPAASPPTAWLPSFSTRHRNMAGRCIRRPAPCRPLPPGLRRIPAALPSSTPPLIAAFIPVLLLGLWLILDLPSLVQVFVSTLVLVDRDLGRCGCAPASDCWGA